jgi:hypothetical protein
MILDSSQVIHIRDINSKDIWNGWWDVLDSSQLKQSLNPITCLNQ